MTCSCVFTEWFKTFLMAGGTMFPLAALSLFCIYLGNRMLRRESYRSNGWRRALLDNVPAYITLLLGFGLGVRLVIMGVM